MDCNEFKKRAKQLKEDIPALYLAMKSKNTPILAKLLAFLTVAYALSPIDLIPDFIPVLGYLDDLILLPLLVVLTIKIIPKEVWLKSKEQAKALIATKQMKKWYYVLPVIVIWLLIFGLIWQLIFK